MNPTIKIDTYYKRNIISVTVLVFCFLFPLHVFGQVLSLDSVLHRIDQFNPMLQEYDRKVQALNAYAEGAGAWMAPMVGVGPFWYPYPGQEAMEGEQGMIMATIEQEIPNPAKIKAKRNYMSSRSRVEQRSRAVQYNALRAEAKGLYYKALVDHKKLNVLFENEKIITLMLRLSQIRYPYNQSSAGNIYKAEGRLHEVKNMIFMTEGDVESTEYRLKSLMNLPHSYAFSIDTATQVSFNGTLVSDTSMLREYRSDIMQLDETIEVMRLNRRIQQNGLKPDFRIRVEHMQPRASGMPAQFSAMAMVTIPIAPWASKMNRADVKGMQYDIEAMEKAREARLIEAVGMIHGMQVQLTRMNRELDNYEARIIPALKKNYETIMLAYEENREQLPEVIDAWETLNMSQMDYLTKLEAYYNMIVLYEKEIER